MNENEVWASSDDDARELEVVTRRHRAIGYQEVVGDSTGIAAQRAFDRALTSAWRPAARRGALLGALDALLDALPPTTDSRPRPRLNLLPLAADDAAAQLRASLGALRASVEAADTSSACVREEGDGCCRAARRRADCGDAPPPICPTRLDARAAWVEVGSALRRAGLPEGMWPAFVRYELAEQERPCAEAYLES